MKLHLAMALAWTAAAQSPAFEVVSIKRTPPGNTAPVDIECRNGRFISGGFPVDFLLRWGWQLPSSRITGLPAWATDWNVSYDVEAKGIAAGAQDCRLMVRRLLADRFSLRAHLEDRPIRAFLLLTTDGGERLRRSTEVNRGGEARLNDQPVRDSPEGRGLSTSGVARALSGHPRVGLPVVDRTGLTGPFAFDLHFSLRDEDGEASLFTALRGVGLKLESATVPLPVLVVDSIRQPSPN